MKQALLLFILTLIFIIPIAFWWQRGTLNPQITTRTLQPSPSTDKNGQDIAVKLEEVAAGLEVPWSMVFTSSNRILVTERPGRIRAVIDGRVSVPLITFPDVSSRSEEGLMGMALDPSYKTNRRLYVCYAYEKQGGLADRVVSLIDRDATIAQVETILDDIPAALNHAGCRIKFGPDNKLYITTGDAQDRQIAQNMNSLGGKILRINADGSIPSDNPFPGSPIWSLGHRNPQGIDWHPVSRALVATEHGPSGFDGPGGGDEVNNIQKGANYGWPLISHNQTDSRFITPLLVFTPAVAPAAGMFYTADVIPQYRNNYFFGALRGQGLYRVVFSDQSAQKVSSFEKVKEVDVGRIREVVQGPDGAIYFTTSNRDGRGTVRPSDDKIYRLSP